MPLGTLKTASIVRGALFTEDGNVNVLVLVKETPVSVSFAKAVSCALTNSASTLGKIISNAKASAKIVFVAVFIISLLQILDRISQEMTKFGQIVELFMDICYNIKGEMSTNNPFFDRFNHILARKKRSNA